MNRYRRLLAAWVAALLVASVVPAAAGVNVWTSHGPEGWGVGALAIDPTTPSTLYVGRRYGRIGGVFKSTNAGTSWETTRGLPTNPFVRALAIDPTAPSTLYAGTTGGVFKSTNAGTSWDPTNTGLTTVDVTVLAIDPTAPSTLYAGTTGGVFKSTNAGTSWDNTGLTTASVSALAIDPTAPSTLYAGTSGGGVFKSTNAGTSWAPVNTGLTTAPVNVLAIDPTVPSTLYAGTQGGGVFESTNAGMSWAPVNTGLTTATVFALAIDPTAPSTLYAGTQSGGVFKSTNAGTSWAPVDTGLTTADVSALAIDPTAPSTLYAGTYGGGVFKSTNAGTSWAPVNTGLSTAFVSALAIDPTAPSTLYAGTYGGGVFKSTNAGTSWAPVNTGLPTAAYVFALAIDPTVPSTLYAGTGDGGVFKSTNAGTSWAPVNTGLPTASVSALAIDPTAPSTLYAGTQSGGVFKSTNAGTSWAPVNTGLTTATVFALAIDPTAPSTLYAGTLGGGVFKSTNAGTSWDNTGLTIASVSALAIDPTAPSTLYAGTQSGGVFKSTNAGTSWAPVNTGLTTATVFALAIDPTAPSTLYAGTGGGGVFKSTNAGTSWDPINTGLTTASVFALAIDSTVPSTLYAGTGGGVFRLDQTVGEFVSTIVGAGESCSTDTEGANGTSDGATAADPIETTVITPNAGLCAITEQPATGSPLPGYSLFGYTVTITAPPATATARLTLVFEIDGSIVPPGQTLNTIRLLKNGVLVGPCVGGNDPCVHRAPGPNGGVKLTVLTSAASVWSPVVATLDSYLCYASAPTKATAPGAPSPGHLLTDALASTRFDFTKPGALCFAAARDGAPITDAKTALQATALKAGKACSDTGLACTKKDECTAPAKCGAQPKFVARKNINVLNALGATVVDATKPTTALLPSATSASTPPGVPNPLLDTFNCYATKPHANVCTGDPTRACENDAACGDVGPCFTGFPKDLTVRLDEPVATAGGKVFAVKKPTALCLPAEVDGAARKVPSVALQCYAIAPAKKQCANTATTNAGASCTQEEDCGGQKKVTSFCVAQAKHAPILGIPVTSAVLGSIQRDTKKEAELCVPSEAVMGELR